MRRALQLVVIAVLAAGVSGAQQVVDRIVATVNRQPVLLSDWEIEVRYEALLNQQPLPFSDQASRAALDRLIDQELLRQQVRSYRVEEPTKEEVDVRVADIRRQLPGVSTDDAFRAALAKYGLTEPEFRERVSTQLLLMHFIDLRLRPSVHIDRRAIDTYYNEKLLPELRKKGETLPALAEVSPQIEELLSQERVDALTSDWLRDLRQQSEVKIDVPGASATSAAKPPEQGRR